MDELAPLDDVPLLLCCAVLFRSTAPKPGLKFELELEEMGAAGPALYETEA